MTLKELSQLHYLRREIEMDRQRIHELETKILPGAQVLTGMPHAPGVSDKVGQCAAEIADLKRSIEAKQRQCLQEQSRLEEYIGSIEDSLTRQVFTYRFVRGLSWSQVAGRVGGRNTAGSVRMLCYRYLRKE
jgi:hypothetical protein